MEESSLLGRVIDRIFYSVSIALAYSLALIMMCAFAFLIIWGASLIVWVFGW